MTRTLPDLTVAVGGYGAIGRRVAEALDRGIKGLRLVAVSARDKAAAEGRVKDLAHPVPVVSLDALSMLADVVVECAPAEVFEEIAVPAVERGRTLIVSTVGALLGQAELIHEARETGSQILVPSGAILGLDALRAAAEEPIHSVTMVTRKPPAGLAGAPYLAERDITLDGLAEPLLVFEGSARDGAAAFPANVNVAAAVSLAGIGADRTMLQVWADPGVERNMHKVVVDAASANFEMSIANVPSDDNPRTGRLTAPSVVACLRRLTGHFVVGS